MVAFIILLISTLIIHFLALENKENKWWADYYKRRMEAAEELNDQLLDQLVEQEEEND